MKPLKQSIPIVLIVMMCAVLQACGKQEQPPSPDGKMKIVTSLFPLYDFTRQIGQQKVEVALLLPPGVEAHSFEPTPADMKRIQHADVFIFTGRFMEPWVDDLLKGIDNRKLMVINAGKGVLTLKAADEHPEEGPSHFKRTEGNDPHTWLDFTNAMKMVDSITEGLSSKDPDNSMFYRKNAEKYKKKLAELDSTYKTTLSRCKHQTLVHAGHFTFNYLAARYGLQYMSAYRGFTPDAEPTPKRLMEMTDYLKKNHISAIFHEELIDPKVARAIANETGASMLMLHGAHNVSRDELARGVAFLDLMEKNLNNLKVGLLCP